MGRRRGGKVDGFCEFVGFWRREMGWLRWFDEMLGGLEEDSISHRIHNMLMNTEITESMIWN